LQTQRHVESFEGLNRS